MSRTFASRLLRLLLALTLVAVIAGGMLLLPTTTLQGVNYRVTAYHRPAYVKTIDFLYRHYEYRNLASGVCHAQPTETACVLALFDWTHDHIRATPDGWPVVDDHPLNIAIRGYGKNDQMADLFSTLTMYAGVPSFFNFIKEPAHGAVLPLAFAKLEGKWIPFDVEHHVVFRNKNGQLRSVEELASDPEGVDAASGGLQPFGVPYSRFISKTTLIPFIPPDPLRPQLQQPLPRVRYELRRALGLRH
jgi:hypothetical protein